MTGAATLGALFEILSTQVPLVTSNYLDSNSKTLDDLISANSNEEGSRL